MTLRRVRRPDGLRHRDVTTAGQLRCRGAASRRTRVAHVVLTLLALVSVSLVSGPAAASPEQEYSRPYFGKGNLPPGCILDAGRWNFDNVCYRMATGLNALDSPKVDVALLVPVSPTAERDMRIARQAIEMWDGGIDYLAPQMGLDWLAEGMEFHITADYIDLQGGDGGEFTTYPIVDPEIVVIVGNPVGTGGIGVDPVEFGVRAADDREEDLGHPLEFTNENLVPCHTVQNPFDFEYWDALPGFDRHHSERSGTYVEDCGGAGGNICFTVAGGADLMPDTHDGFKVLFDLVAHEFGHCLSLGHVGDGSEGIQGGAWGPSPYSDIMSYSDFPMRRTTCPSTLNVEGLALRMSRYLDVNGDGVVDSSDELVANDSERPGRPRQVQHPDDYLHASGTGSALDCPQPDLGLLPGERTDWTPEPVDSVDHLLNVATPAEGTVSSEGRFEVGGTVERHELSDDTAGPTASVEDARGDSSHTFTDVLGVSADVTATELHVTMRMADMWSTTPLESPVSYRLMISGWEVETFFRQGAVAISSIFGGSASWDLDNKTVTFKISRDRLTALSIRAPYKLSTAVERGVRNNGLDEDYAPELGRVLAVGDSVAGCGDPCPDADGDGVADRDDDCPQLSGNGADGCVIVATEHVHVYVDGAHAASQDIDTSRGADSFNVSVAVPEGAHTLRVDWEDEGEVVATKSVSVRTSTDDDGDGVPNPEDVCPGFDDRADVDGDGLPDACDPDLDGDGLANGADNCSGKANADQADMDGDRRGDVCDPDMDGDGHSNAREAAFGTDPADPKSFPVSPRAL